MTTALFLLRCTQLGINLSELGLLSVGMVNEMFIEHQNDDYKYAKKASQEDFNNF